MGIQCGMLKTIYMMKKRAFEYQIVAYCSECGKEITRSAKFSKKKLISVWDDAVTVAPKPGVFPICECLKDKQKKVAWNFHFIFRIAVYKPDGTCTIEESKELLKRLKKK